MRSNCVGLLAFGFSILGLIPLAPTATAQTPLTTARIASGLNQPTWLGAPAGDSRIFICERGGRIKLLEGGAVTSFLDFNSQVSTGGDGGLMGLAFHPNYAVNGFFFVHYSRPGGDSVISRFQVSTNPDVAAAGSEAIVLVQDQPSGNHNGGTIAFGPDGYLYIPFGDGGSQNDPNCNAQRMTTWLGKVLRIDVDTLPYSVPPDNPFLGVPGALPEIYHLGLREPWRVSFDRVTGDFYIGDVGQGDREEVSFAGAGQAGLNFGWKVFEGTLCHSLSACPGGTPSCSSQGIYEPPIHELIHSAPSHPRSVIGGYVYRGCAIPDLQGAYFFSDYSDDLIRSFRYDAVSGTINDFQDRTAELTPGGGLTLRKIATFGEDGQGELLMVDHVDGEVFKLVPASATASSASVFNGLGLNTLCFSNRSNPIIGNVWRTEVDVSGHPGATLVGMQGRQATASGVFFNGQEILITGTRYYRVTRAVSGASVEFDSLLPCDVSLSGAVAHNQAYIFGGAGLELCNGLSLTVGNY